VLLSPTKPPESHIGPRQSAGTVVVRVADGLSTKSGTGSTVAGVGSMKVIRRALRLVNVTVLLHGITCVEVFVIVVLGHRISEHAVEMAPRTQPARAAGMAAAGVAFALRLSICRVVPLQLGHYKRFLVISSSLCIPWNNDSATVFGNRDNRVSYGGYRCTVYLVLISSFRIGHGTYVKYFVVRSITVLVLIMQLLSVFTTVVVFV
jgi:hypothetical protein